MNTPVPYRHKLRSYTVGCSVTEDEKITLSARAAKNGTTMDKLIRDTLTAAGLIERNEYAEKHRNRRVARVSFRAPKRRDKPVVLESPFPQKVAEKREAVADALHMSRWLSWRLFRPHAGGTVLVKDVWRLMLAAAQNGETFDPASDLRRDAWLDIDQCEAATSMPRVMLYKIVRKAPHLAITRKTVLIRPMCFQEAIDKTAKRCKCHLPTSERNAQ